MKVTRMRMVTGDALDPDGFKPATANYENDGWYAICDNWGVSEGSDLPHYVTLDDWNGHSPVHISAAFGSHKCNRSRPGVEFS